MNPELIVYEITDPTGWSLVPAHVKRPWMEAQNGFAYRCLPMTMANIAGWVIECPTTFVAEWIEGMNKEGLRLTFDESVHHFARQITSHFGNGIVTFNLPWLFRTTPEGVSLRVSGAPNYFKANASACEGLVETDWLEFTFTMNWKLHRTRDPVIFVKGDPICFLQPISLDIIEVTQPVAKKLVDDPDLKAKYDKYNASRTAFNASAHRTPDMWQKYYHSGMEMMSPPDHHRTKLSLKSLQSPS